MERQDERDHGSNRSKHGRDLGRPGRVVDVARAVDRRDRVALGQRERRADRARIEPIQVVEERVDHRVADEVHAVPGDSLRGQVVDALRAGHEQQVGQLIGDPAVHLLGHRFVEAAQAGLDVSQPEAELRGGKCGGKGRVHVAVHDRQGWPGRRQLAFEGHEECRGLAHRRSGSDPEVHVRVRQAEVAEEHVREDRVVVLSRVDHELMDSGSAERGHDRRRFHEVRSRPHDVRDDRSVIGHPPVPSRSSAAIAVGAGDGLGTVAGAAAGAGAAAPRSRPYSRNSTSVWRSQL